MVSRKPFFWRKTNKSCKQFTSLRCQETKLHPFPDGTYYFTSPVPLIGSRENFEYEKAGKKIIKWNEERESKRLRQCKTRRTRCLRWGIVLWRVRGWRNRGWERNKPSIFCPPVSQCRLSPAESQSYLNCYSHYLNGILYV